MYLINNHMYTSGCDLGGNYQQKALKNHGKLDREKNIG